MVELEPAEVLKPAEAGARLVALRLLDEAHEACARIADPEDTEALHDLRVALRRLRSTLAAYRTFLDPRATRDALARAGRLAAQTGAARDAEVGLAWLLAQHDALRPAHRATLAALLDAFEAQVRTARASASEQLAKRFAELEDELRDPLETYRARVAPSSEIRAACFARAASDALRFASAELERALARVTDPDDIAAEHQARIVAKRLRYLLEPVLRQTADGPALLAELKRLQTLIGDRHDRDVLASSLLTALERAALANAQAQAHAVRTRDPRSERRLRARTSENVLLGLLRRARGEADALFAKLEAGWLGGKSADFFARVESLADALRALDAANLEIERKYLLRGLPECVQRAESIEIEQGYLPGGVMRDRLRRAIGPRGTRLTRTLKVGTGIVRAELEEELPEAEFARLWPQTTGARLRKRRYLVPDGPLVWEIDEFLDRDLVLAEIELPTADFEVVVPEWLAPWLVREATDESAYSNLRLACEPSSSS